MTELGQILILVVHRLRAYQPVVFEMRTGGLCVLVCVAKIIYTVALSIAITVSHHLINRATRLLQARKLVLDRQGLERLLYRAHGGLDGLHALDGAVVQ